MVAVIATGLAVGGATYMMLKPSTKVDGVAVLMDGRQEAASTTNPSYGLTNTVRLRNRRLF
ncbi:MULTISPECIES: hypothetical protein [Wolbachia]|uniref:hypothetical protein n=1 Tax=Wolbachia TaxID=953 RepID=UPI00202157B0|nr:MULTISPECIES: hypothetical protein [unclassified Wolbachia]